MKSRLTDFIWEKNWESDFASAQKIMYYSERNNRVVLSRFLLLVLEHQYRKISLRKVREP